MPRLKYTIPAYRLHKARGLAVVNLDGKDIYLGLYGSEQSKAEYERLVADWLKRKNLNLPSGIDLAPSFDEITVVELIEQYLEHVKTYYPQPIGHATTESDNIKLALKPLEELYSLSKVAEFGPKALKQVRNSMIDKKWKRKHVNRQVARIKAMFRWGVEEELIHPSTYHSLMAVRGLARGRSTAPEGEQVQPARASDVEAIEPFVSKQVWAMIQVQLLTGMRPGEVVIMRGCDLQMLKDGPVWTYTPSRHKTEHHGKSRAVKIGPKARAIIERFLKPNLAEYLFSPIDAEVERREKLREKRKTPPGQGNVPGSNRKVRPRRAPAVRYTVASYRRAIQRGCVKADRWQHGGLTIPEDQVLVHEWHPHQLRHNTATALRHQFGLEAARVVLGHSSPLVTEIYAKLDESKAEQVMHEIG